MVDDFDWDGDTLAIGDDEGGALVLTDEPTVNQQGVDAPGLMSALTDFINAGVFNGNFRFGPPEPFLDASNSTSGSNFMPGWRFVRSSNSNITVSHVRDASSPSGSNIRFSFASGVASDAAYLEQVIDIGGSRVRHTGDYLFGTGRLVSGANVGFRLFSQYLTTDGSIAGMPAEASSGYFGTSSTASVQYTLSSLTPPPSNARYLRLRVEASRVSGTAAAVCELIDVRRHRGMPFYPIHDLSASTSPGAIYQSSGYPRVLIPADSNAELLLGYQLVPLHFAYVDMPAGATTELRPVDGGAGIGSVPRLAMPWEGHIVGMTYRMTDAPTAGTFTLRATVNGSNVWSPFGAVGSGGSATGYQTQAIGADPFGSGDVLGVDCVTTAGYLPVTRDFAVILWVAIKYGG